MYMYTYVYTLLTVLVLFFVTSDPLRRAPARVENERLQLALRFQCILGASH